MENGEKESSMQFTYKLKTKNFQHNLSNKSDFLHSWD